MLESLLKFKEVDKNPYLTFIWALLITTVGILFSLQLSYQVQVSNTVLNLTGIFAVLFTIIPSVYFLTTVIKREEAIEEEMIDRHYEKGFWKRHEKDLLLFLFYFIGVALAFAVWSFVLPSDSFHIQLAKIYEIKSSVTGAVISKGSFDSFLAIFTNNMEVMLFAFVFSLLFGAGAVFIIVWNASVLGVYIGGLSKTLYEVPIVSLSFLPHGLPEIAGYLAAGLAGGLLSAAILRSRKTRILRIIFFDCIKILVLGVFLLVVAAGIEVYL